MSNVTAQWARTHAFGGRIVGEFTSTETIPPRQMVVIMTLNGPEIAPRDALIPLDDDDVIGSLAHRIEDVLDAAEQVGYNPDEIRAAVALALQRKTTLPT
ncbi:MAG: hypothetical protein AB4911_12960 [Oscillochloridaceae bacterium umkhey_bin13]